MLSSLRAVTRSQRPTASQTIFKAKPKPKRNFTSKAETRQENGWVGTVHEDKTEGEAPALDQALKAHIEPVASNVKGGEEPQIRAEEWAQAKDGEAHRLH